VKTWVWNKYGWEIVNVNVQWSIETKGSSHGGNNLRDKSVDVGVGWTLNIKRGTAYVVKSLVVKVEGKVRVLKKRSSCKYSVVWLNNSGRYLWGWSDGVGHLGLTRKVNSKTLKKKRSKTRSSSSSSRMENKESLKCGTVISLLTDLVQYLVDDILSNGVVTTSVVICSIFLSRDDGLWVIKSSVVSSTDRVSNSRLKIYHNSARNVLSTLGLSEESIVRRVFNSSTVISWNESILSNSVLEAVKLPTGVTYCKTSLSNVNTQ
jgi:hypothetical protein